MTLTEVGRSGAAYLAEVTTLLQRMRHEHPTRGVWEAADLQWWWRIERRSDAWLHPFWLDDTGLPVAAAITTDWGDRVGLDVLVGHTVPADKAARIWRRGMSVLATRRETPGEVMVDDTDITAIRLLGDAGFARAAGTGVSAWLTSVDQPPVSPLAAPYTLSSRVDMTSPHHMSARLGPDVERRLLETSLYRPSLDLAVTTPTGEVAGYGLFWYDPATAVGFVEPLATAEHHRRRGIARHVLTEGIARLVGAGASRVKINYEAHNEASSTLYTDLGFVPSMTTSLFTRGTAELDRDDTGVGTERDSSSP